MKFPWFSSKKSSEKTSEENIQYRENTQKEEVNNTYKLSSLPENHQKIQILIKQNDQEIKYLKKKIEVCLSAKTVLEENLFKELKSIKE
tara:strand:+ start:1281 stop:1547 length:267 start_codon:yes stop_codon:yes gene_type:complete